MSASTGDRVDGAMVERFRNMRPNFAVAFGAFVLIVVVVIVRNRWILTTGRIEDSDYAANSILIDKARHFKLLVGNYSRVEFNHPGPALLYVQAIGQVLL